MSVVFDTEALLAFYLGEDDGEEVMKILTDVQEGKVRGYLNIVNLSELYYILYRKSPMMAEEKERSLRGFGLEIVPLIDDQLWKEAAIIKGKRALSLADAFAAATVKVYKAKLLTLRDEEFSGLEIPLIRIGKQRSSNKSKAL